MNIWIEADIKFCRGMKFEYRGGTAKIMEIADNWIMARKPRAAPFTVYYKEAINSVK